MTWLLDLLRKHWPLAVPAALGFALGWVVFQQPPQPAVALKQDTAVQKAATAATAKKDSKGAETVARRVYRTDCPPGSPPVLASETTIHRGPEVIDSTSQSQRTERLDQHVDLTISPASPPRWALGAGLEDPLGTKRLRLEGGMRLLGPVWLRAGVAPARGLSSATVGAEVQW